MRATLRISIALIFAASAMVQNPSAFAQDGGAQYDLKAETDSPDEAPDPAVPAAEPDSQPDTKPATSPEAEAPKAEKVEPGRKMSASGCYSHRELYAKSSARKLYRALRSKGWRLKDLAMSGPIEIERRDTKLQFQLFAQNEGKAAALVASSWRETYAIVLTKYGPVIAAHRWPTKAELRSGKFACEPVSSRIAFPGLEVTAVDVEPFEFWGLRVVWRLPNKLNRQARKTTLYDAITRSVRKMQR